MNRYWPAADRYDGMTYRRGGRRGLQLPALSLGLWNHFGAAYSFENARALVRTAFDLGITHFDLANDYGPRPAPRKRLSVAFCNRISRSTATNSWSRPRRDTACGPVPTATAVPANISWPAWIRA